MDKGSTRMKCVHCEGKVYVVETELRKHDILVYRRRGCRKCGRRFSTYEISVEDYRKMKVSKDKLDWFADEFRR